MIERDPRNRNWRLVCHACGFKYPMNAACKASCCVKPQLHIHNTDKPCILCKEELKHFDQADKNCFDYGCTDDCPVALASLKEKS